MRHPFRALALFVALSAAPACASLQSAAPRIENPMIAARMLDQRAYAIVHTYAAVIEEATDIIRDPAAPPALLATLADAERVATPAVESLAIAARTYFVAQAQLEAASAGNPKAAEGAATALAIAAIELNQAIETAQAPVAEFTALVRASRR